MPDISLSYKVIAYFWSKVDVRSGRETGCWEFRGARSPSGYGKFSAPSPTGPIQIAAHRMAYMIAAGEQITSDDYICHHCDNPPCCNPAHLFKGTALENNRDAFSKRRNVPPREHANFIHPWQKRPELVRRGSDVHWASMTEEAVRQILLDRAAGASVPQLADKYGRSKEGITQICSGRKWKHVHAALDEATRAKLTAVRDYYRKSRKLSGDDVAAIRRLLNDGIAPKALALKFNVSSGTIYHIKNGRSWAP